MHRLDRGGKERRRKKKSAGDHLSCLVCSSLSVCLFPRIGCLGSVCLCHHPVRLFSAVTGYIPGSFPSSLHPVDLSNSSWPTLRMWVLRRYLSL